MRVVSVVSVVSVSSRSMAGESDAARRAIGTGDLRAPTFARTTLAGIVPPGARGGSGGTWGRWLAFAVAAACGAAGLAYLVCSLHARPYGPVEAELVFEASRIQRGWPLYVDPVVGAWEAGPPPSRYYVLYTPVWPWVLAHLPGASSSLVAMRTGGRALCGLLWLATLAFLVWSSARTNRLTVATGALLALGFAMLVREASLATADMPAVALATFALARLARQGRLDGVSACLLAAAPLVKPSVLGGAVGGYAAHLVAGRLSSSARGRGPSAVIAPVAWAAVVGGSLIALFHVWSHGQWLTHIVRATGQTISLDRWVHEFGARAALLGAPHVAILVVAMRRRAPLGSTLPLAASTAWSTFAMAKHGSGTHYWLEPTALALVTIGAMPASSSSARTPWLAWAGAALSIACAAASLPVLLRAPADDRASQERIGAIRARCVLSPGEVLVSDDVTLELEIDGRILVPVWQTSYLVRRGVFPLASWRQDLTRPEVRWFVHDRSLLEPAPTEIEGITEVSAFRKELRDVIARSFVEDPSRELAGLLVFRRR